MKKKILIALTSLYIILLAIVLFFVVQFWSVIKAALPMISYSNIKSLYIAAVMDGEEQTQRLKDIDDNLSDEIKDYVSVEIRDFTEEELRQIESGEKTKTQIVAEIITETATPTPPQTNIGEIGDATGDAPQVDAPQVNIPENTPPETNAPETVKPQDVPKTETADEIVARHIANLYSYHGEFEGRVSALASTARNWMHAYKKANNVTWRDAKVATMEHFMSQATQIENECYAKVDAEVVALEKDLKAIGADTSVVKTVKDAAYNEMEVRKSKIVSEGTAKLNKE